MPHLVEEAFAKQSVDLYRDVLQVSRTCSPTELRKAYYKQALKFHPDKSDSKSSKLKFQAVSWTFEYLKDPEKRADYDEHGTLPAEDDDTSFASSSQWKDYFSRVFGQVSVGKINEFAMKYKMSAEEEKDVLCNYEKFKGNLIKMLDYVMLSEERDVKRWMEDYIQPAIAIGKVKDYTTLSNDLVAKIEKKQAAKRNEAARLDSDRTDTEDSDVAAPIKKRATKIGLSKEIKKAKGKQISSENSLVAAIRNRGASDNLVSNLGKRYGVHMNTDDPLDDETFSRLQKKYKK